MEVQALMEAIVMLVFAFNTVAVVALIIAATRICRGLNNIWRNHTLLCRMHGLSYMGYWEGVDKSKIEHPSLASSKLKKDDKPSTRKVA